MKIDNIALFYTMGKHRMNGDGREEKAPVESPVSITTQRLKDAQGAHRIEELAREGKISISGSLAATIAHEIKNPLSIINMSIQYIHSKLEPDDPLLEYTKLCIQKIEKLDNIAGYLLRLGR